MSSCAVRSWRVSWNSLADADNLKATFLTAYGDDSLDRRHAVTLLGDGPEGTALPRPRKRETSGKALKFRMGCGTLFVTVNSDDQGLREVFANLGKAGGCPSQSEATCRAVFAALRAGVDPRALIEQIKGIRCLSTCVARKDNKDVDVLSCPDAIAKAIEEALGDTPGPEPVRNGNTCPDCGSRLQKEEGCFVCHSCGYSGCG